MFQFPREVKNKLIEAGWSEKRNISIKPFEDSLNSENYKMHFSAQRFLENFGNLKISFKSRNGTKDYMHFNVSKAVEDVFPVWIQKNYATRLNNYSLCPIGQVYSNHITLIMDDKGKVYGGFDDELFFISFSGEEAIVSIYYNLVFEKIA